MIKRGFDVLISGLGLILLWPIFLTIGLLTKLDSKGPVIFKQRRVGKEGQVFWIYKFRTMTKGADKQQGKYMKLNESCKPMFKIKDDPRFTKFGKKLSWSGLDELPQLINVLRGEMSLVGPRPLPVNEERELPKSFQKLRRSVLPGITSLWIIKGGHNLTYRQWIKWDADYVKANNIKLDFEILRQTARIIICQLIT